MKHVWMLVLACSLSVAVWGGEIHLDAVKKKPNFLVVMHASRDYRLYFETSDLRKAFKLLPQNVQSRYDISFLQDSQLYRIDLSTDRRMQYNSQLQPLIQHELGAFLLLHGKA
jgi:hypothetical protein